MRPGIVPIAGLWHISEYRAKKRRRNNLKRVKDFLPESQGQNLAVAVLYAPYSLDSSLLGHPAVLTIDLLHQLEKPKLVMSSMYYIKWLYFIKWLQLLALPKVHLITCG